MGNRTFHGLDFMALTSFTGERETAFLVWGSRKSSGEVWKLPNPEAPPPGIQLGLWDFGALERQFS